VVEGGFQMEIPGGASDQAVAPAPAAAADLAAAPALVAGHLLTEGSEALPAYPADTQAAAPEQAAAAPSPAASAQGDGQADLLFVQQATTAQLIFDDPNTATDHARLVLYGVAPATTWCEFLHSQRLFKPVDASAQDFATGPFWKRPEFCLCM
jgi:hypothetical protein